MDEIEERGIAAVTVEAMEAAWRGTRGVYVSYDIDVPRRVVRARHQRRRARRAHDA